MTSVALAFTGPGDNAHSSVAAMLVGMKDRSPAWAVAGSSHAAVGVGAGSSDHAEHDIRALAGDVILGIDAPRWIVSELDSELSALGEPEIGANAASLVRVLAGLAGDAHCVATVGSRGCLAYRGPLSSRPLFYTVGANGALFVASQIRGLLGARPASVNLAGLAPFLVPQLCDSVGTAWEGIRRLPPGHVLLAWDGEIDVRPIARVEAAQVKGAGRDDLIAAFRQRLFQAIERCSEPPDGVLLSGGIDSSSLACGYSALRTGTGRAFALTYDDRLAPCDERRYVDDVQAATGMPVSRLAGNRLLPLVADFPEADEPEPWAYAARNWALLRHITADKNHPTATIIAGEGGDELLLGQVFAVADRHARGDVDGARREIATFPASDRVAKVLDGLLSGAYDRIGHRMQRALGDVPPWLSGRYVGDTNIVDRLANGYPHLGEPGQMAVNYSRALMDEAGAAGRVQCGGWWEDMGRKAGVKITYPFLDPDLAALTWALPPQLLRDDGLEKVVLREALNDLLPDSVAQRRDKAEALALMHAGLGERADTIRAVARGGPLADHGVIQPDKLLAATGDYLSGRRDLGPALWATVAVDRWLTQQADPASEDHQ